MGKRGARRTAEAEREKDDVVQLLAPLGNIAGRSMFGGFGLFESGKMFGLISPEGKLHFKVGEANRTDYEESSRYGKMPYAAVPPDVRAHTKDLRAWAKRAIAASKGG